MPQRRTSGFPAPEDSLWYQDAIIYELHVRAFADSDGDGVGDFQGLMEKLDYLEDLGINALWLLPFYPSPLKDDGYDIADYEDIQPAYGTLSDFKAFVEEAHRRGIRVITELVINHTSDQHPWFQRARKAQPGSRWRDFYVWSDTTEKYRDARIIFKDFEHSNWTLDPVTKQYYWHRFYSHQPDLNYDNPAVHRAIFKVMDYWLKMGVDGLRVDAVPYLYEREGTNCENLPETHEFIRLLRKHVDSRFRDRMLLAEANQWSDDAAAYFGEADEFHMAFHFPLMPRMFMAIRMEDRFPIVDILQETPAIPETCQWALFLRNHDELTLEMVTDEERDYMYRMYAHDSTARINLGIRRRLAPLLNNDRKKIELMNALLFSLPGTPVIYYGDEIGMGDNFYLGDRNGVRTPMQWSPDRNAGFSRANPQRLYLPPIIDPEYHYEAINVETQQQNPDSLLWRMKHMIGMRKRFKAFGRGSFEFLLPDNRKVLAFLRRYQDETILVIANLSQAAQQARLNLSSFEGLVPVELFGREEFHPITQDDYFFTLNPHGFYWFSLGKGRSDSPRLRALPEPETRGTPPTIELSEEKLFEEDNWAILEMVLPDYIRECRWFRGKARNIRAADIQDIIPLRFTDLHIYLILVELRYTSGEPETYAVPVRMVPQEYADALAAEHPHSVIAGLKFRTKKNNSEMALADAMMDRDAAAALLTAFGRRRRFKGQRGELSANLTQIFRSVRGPARETLEPVPVHAEQTNSSVVYSDRLVLKLFRRLEEGLSPDVEIGRFLTDNTGFTQIAPVAGSLEYRVKRHEPVSVAVLQEFVPNEGDAWKYTLDSLDRYYQYVLTHPTVQIPPIPRKPLASILKEPPQLAMETIGPYLASAQLLGSRTAEMHIALASAPENPDFAPEAFSIIYQNSLYHSMRSLTLQTFQNLREQSANLPENAKDDARRVIDLEKAIIDGLQPIRKQKMAAQRIRCHGDYHLGQVLYTGKDFVIIDFEGEPARPLTERRLKRCPLRDVAGMMRSFHYAAYTALGRHTTSGDRTEDQPVLEQWGRYWYVWVSSVFLASYLDKVSPAKLVPDDLDQLGLLLEAYLLEKAIYEVGYELNNRPGWVRVPLQGILDLMEAGRQ